MNVVIAPPRCQALEALRHHEATLPLPPRAQPLPAPAALHAHEPAKGRSTLRLTGIQRSRAGQSCLGRQWIEQASSPQGARRSAKSCRQATSLGHSRRSPMNQRPFALIHWPAYAQRHRIERPLAASGDAGALPREMSEPRSRPKHPANYLVMLQIAAIMFRPAVGELSLARRAVSVRGYRSRCCRACRVRAPARRRSRASRSGASPGPVGVRAGGRG